MWDQNVPEHEPAPKMPVHLEDLDDGRCKVSSWRGHVTTPLPEKPDYESYFGPGGYNRCIGDEDHANPLHKDEWGNVFVVEPVFHVVRTEPVR